MFCCFVFQTVGEGLAAAGEKSWQASLTSFSFLHSVNLLCAEYLISTPLISSTEGMGQCWPTRNPIHFCTQQKRYSKHGSLPETRSSCGAVSPKKRTSGSKFLHPSLPRVPSTSSLLEALGRTLGLEARAVCGGLKAGRGAQPHPHEKSCVLHLPAASSWLLIPPLSLHVPQEPAFEVAY